MHLTLTILTGPDGAPRDSRVFAPGAFTLGRAPDNDWVLPDPQRHLSKRHCTVTFRNGFWTLADLSTNGTFLDNEPEPIGHAGVHELRDGDRIRLGGYEIMVRIEAAAVIGDPLTLSFDAPAVVGFAGPVRGGFGLPPDSSRFGTPLETPAPFGGQVLLDRPDDGDLSGPVQPDHSPGIEDAFHPPRPVVLLDGDWDLAEPAGVSALASPAMMPDLASDVAPDRSLPASTDDLLAAFLRGAGMLDARPADPVAAMEGFGAAFRALATGLRGALMARAAVKSEFRIGQTMIRSHGNNPLKFSASDEDALLALLGTGRRTEMPPATAVAEGFRDLRLHELATMAAMQSAVRGLLQELEPGRFRDSASGGLLGLQRKHRAWEAYEAAHARITQAMADSFDSAFGKVFAKAYEQALREIRPEGR